VKHATVLVSCLIWVFMLLVPLGAAYGDVAAPDCTKTPPPEATGTPWLQTEYPTATPWDTATPWPTATYVTPTSPPPETPVGEPTPTVTVYDTPDPSATATVTPGDPDRKASPTPNMVMPETGLPLLPTFFLGFAFFAVAFITGMIRRTR